MLLIGGLDAWKREFGDREVDRGISSSGSPAPALNGGIASGSSSSMRYASPPYVCSGSGTEHTHFLSATSRVLGALNENPRLPPPTEPSPGPSCTLPQPSEGINGFRRGSKAFNRRVVINSRPLSPDRTDLVCASFYYRLKLLLRLV